MLPPENGDMCTKMQFEQSSDSEKEKKDQNIEENESNIPNIKKPRLPKGTTGKVDKKSAFHNRTSFRGVPFNRQFITAVSSLYKYFSQEKYVGGPLISVQQAR